MGPDPEPIFANLFLAHKEAELTVLMYHVSLKLSMLEINISFWFIDDLLSVNDGSTFVKQFKDIYPTELELMKENNSNSCASFLDLYIYVENGKFHTRLFDKRDNFGFDIVRMPFYCSNIPRKMLYERGALKQSFLQFLEQPVKLKIFLVIVNSCDKMGMYGMYVWELKEKSINHFIKLYITMKSQKYVCGSRKCDLYIWEKLLIAKADPNDLPNKRDNLFQSACIEINLL